jgi:hypothetical protein
MVDFKKLVKKKRTIDVTNLFKLFESLDRHTSHTELRPAQAGALKTLGERRNKRDVVLKLSTGAGKTVAALLYLQSHMEEKEAPVVYLCPTKQLMEQVREEASKLGINAVVYPAGKSHPPVDGISGKAIIICTYGKLFNAKTTFDRNDVQLRPCAIVLDDAHAGVEEIRDAFTLRIYSNELRTELLKLLTPACKNFKQGLWLDILRGDPNATMEVPYWIWQPIIDEVYKLVSPQSQEFMFVWPFLRDMLHMCRCIISGEGIEMSPDIPPIHMVQAFDDAKHRLFMSATLADDATLIRELGCDISAASDPILPESDSCLGERMILAPSLIDDELNRPLIMNLCQVLSKKNRVVVLSPSEKTAREWEKVGAKVVLNPKMSSAVESLKDNSSNSRFVVFVQRYDGIDLPDKTCRILVLDGMPYGKSITDKYDSSITTGGTRNRLIYRIDQGMGRAVRSHADYAVVLLVGSALANFIAKRDVLNAMAPDTKAQLELAHDLAKLAREEDDENLENALIHLIKQCLNRDEGWRQYYDENVRKGKKQFPKKTDNARLKMADAERKAFQSAIANNPSEAVKNLRQAINDNVADEKETGWYLQKVAKYLFKINGGDALEVQCAAFEKNHLMFCPPSGIIRKPPIPTQFDVQTTLLKWYKAFENPNGAVAAIQELRANLSYNVRPNTIEQAIMDLAPLLGAKGYRPEKEFGEGPDNLWIWPSICLIIEAKTENKETLHKKDAGQMLLSLQWFKRSYPTLKDNAIPVVIANVSTADRKAGFPDGTRVLTPDKMQDLLKKLEGFFQALIGDVTNLQPQEIAGLQTKSGLSPAQFIGKYTVRIKEPK